MPTSSLRGAAPTVKPACAPQLALIPGDFVAVVGDSITEQKEYSVFIEDYLLMCLPTAPLRVAQFGWSGETATGFAQRQDQDLTPFAPSVVTTCFGMNDGGYAPLTYERAARFVSAQHDIVRKCKAAGVREIVLGSPGCVDSELYHHNPAEAALYNEALGQETELAREVASQEGVRFADVHAAMTTVMKKAKQLHGATYPLAGSDGIHPDPNGHLCMAFAFLKALGCSGEIGRIEVDLTSHKVTASAGHRVLGHDRREIQLESTRYPFCFLGYGPSPGSTRSILAALPFNDELNRFTLQARGARAERYRVTWGAAQRVFTAGQLATGINLAAEFLDNPFSEPFRAVEAAIRAQQNKETRLVKVDLQALHAQREKAPEEAPAWDRAQASLLGQARLSARRAFAAFRPVRHTLRVEPIP